MFIKYLFLKVTPIKSINNKLWHFFFFSSKYGQLDDANVNVQKLTKCVMHACKTKHHSKYKISKVTINNLCIKKIILSLGTHNSCYKNQKKS